MAGTNDMGRKSRRRSCSHWDWQSENGCVESAVRRSISGDIPEHYRRIYNEIKITEIAADYADWAQTGRKMEQSGSFTRGGNAARSG
jgi:hypothetical protein